MNDDIYLTAKQVKARYGGLSDMSLWRWLRDAKSEFPSPIMAGRKRLWLLRDLEKWERSRASSKAAA